MRPKSTAIFGKVVQTINMPGFTAGFCVWFAGLSEAELPLDKCPAGLFAIPIPDSKDRESWVWEYFKQNIPYVCAGISLMEQVMLMSDVICVSCVLSGLAAPCCLDVETLEM